MTDKERVNKKFKKKLNRMCSTCFEMKAISTLHTNPENNNLSDRKTETADYISLHFYGLFVKAES